GNTAAPDMNSYNHVMLLGDLLIWYYENLAGIKSNPDYPGFKELIMRPELIDGLDFVNASYKSAYGLIKSEWKKEGRNFQWKIKVPANTSAIIYVPAKSNSVVSKSRLKNGNFDGAHFIGMNGTRAMYKIGSGNYEFNSRY
ncbi:MAG TPA: alpha-L-rhamnosidase C-terminal domain-containing protein, partial [Draconibacterium sp.]|nr:alpha-L-rhamnosidase C-terminal domain-containing protein [Draconibacterium sp.]